MNVLLLQIVEFLYVAGDATLVSSALLNTRRWDIETSSWPEYFSADCI